MLGTILISGLLVCSPDTVGFTLVPKHTVYLDRTFSSFNEIVSAREGIYDLGVGSINIPLTTDSLRLAIIVYGSEKARAMQLQRVENFLNRSLVASSGGFTYFGTPFGGPPPTSLLTQSSIDNKTPVIPLDTSVVILDSLLLADRSSDITNILESGERKFELEPNSDLNSLLSSDDSNQNLTSVLRQDSVDAYLSAPPINSNQNALEVLKDNSENALNVLKISPVTQIPIQTVQQQEFKSSQNLSLTSTNIQKETNKIPALEVEQSKTLLRIGTESVSTPAAPVSTKSSFPTSNEAQALVEKNIQSEVPNISPISLPPSQTTSNQHSALVGETKLPNQPKSIEKPKNSVSEFVSKSSPIPPAQGSARTIRNSIEQFTSSIRKPYREIELKEQERGRYYIVFGHFTSKPNASHYARGVRKRYPETHLSPSQQGYRVLMDANQEEPVEHLRSVRLEYPKAWLSKPRKSKPLIEGN